ncbi:phage Gp37/Gp68 family protein [Caballeronia sp. dw_19]|uniref:phage Gp37/Gp68 family protein n=1 Tax=Caballeronia sp. dw_19 TaxID=2719791 RepID=UPI001BCEB0E1|nr:phage Gp37/Gp68 family protein [Caballeronia sp. dw_19]
MSENSKIEWTDHTFNPWEGCQRVGPGCDHCYAEARNSRFGGGTAPNWGPGAPRRRTSPANWRKPIAWNTAHTEFFGTHGRRQRVFCASIADVFDNAVDPAWRVDLVELIAETPNLDWLILTKRIGNASAMWPAEPMPNVWLGATIINQEEADRDIPKLLDTPAAVRFLSMEPLLGPVDLNVIDIGGHGEIYPLSGTQECEDDDGNSMPDLPAIDWVIVGGESGTDARPMHPSWVRSLRDQCADAGVPFLFKQWGEWTDEDWGERAGLRDTAGVLPSGEFALMSQGYLPPFDDGERLAAAGNVRLDGRTLMVRVGKRAAGRELDGATHDGFPEEL